MVRLIVRICFVLLFLPPLSMGAQSSRDVTFAISFPGSRAEFHVGERVPVELSLSSSVPNTYELNTRSYDRSGRLGLEQFHMHPDGRDPLQRYFAEGGFMGGGLGGLDALTEQPWTLREDLNEWVVPDRPGHYTLYLTTTRVLRVGGSKVQLVELRSNELAFDLVAADAAWKQQTLASAAATLQDSSGGSWEREEALRTLRFLDTPGSVSELVRELGRSGESCWECVAGLAGSARQDEVVHALEQGFSAPDSAITSSYLSTLAKLKFQLASPPPAPYRGTDETERAARDAVWRERSTGMADTEEALYREAASSVSGKTGRAKAETIRTLLMRPAQQSSDLRPLAEVSQADVAAAFAALGAQEQESLLSYFWQRLDVPSMTGALVEIARQPSMEHSDLRDVALERLYQLDPGAGAPVLLDEIQRPHVDGERYTVRGETLGVLPDATLPQFDDVLVRRLQAEDSRTVDLDAQLVGRFATAAILARVKTIYSAAEGRWDCVAEDGFVRYFLRVDADYGVRELKQAPSVCMTTSMPAAVRMKRWNEVEPVIIAAMDLSDLHRARQAAETLSQYGDGKAEAAMWARMRKFHEQWKDREADFQPSIHQPRDANEAGAFQYGLVQALGRATGWVLTNEDIGELLGLALGPERDNITPWQWKPPLSLHLVVPFEGELQASINDEYTVGNTSALCEKLSQFPDGTEFKVTVFGQAGALAPVLEAVHGVAAAHGLRLDESP